jgi:hypothetical protein
MIPNAVRIALFVPTLLCGFSPLGVSQTTPSRFQFEQFPVAVYHGNPKVSPEFFGETGSWRKEPGKASFKLKPNFAGEYYLDVRSCGTCCRYYSLNNLRTGAAVKEVSMFDAGDPSPLTKDGHSYVPILITRPGSALMIVQYEIDLCTPVQNNPCRQRYFVFRNGRFKAISGTTSSCSREYRALAK